MNSGIFDYLDRLCFPTINPLSNKWTIVNMLRNMWKIVNMLTESLDITPWHSPNFLPDCLDRFLTKNGLSRHSHHFILFSCWLTQGHLLLATMSQPITPAAAAAAAAAAATPADSNDESQPILPMAQELVAHIPSLPPLPPS